MTTKYIYSDTQISDYMVFPRFLLNLPINGTTMLVYIILLDRSRLSCRDPVWFDPQGRVFVRFTVKDLAKRLEKGMTVIKKSLISLEKHGLIRREHQGIGKPNRIYVLLPDRDSSLSQPEKRLVKKPVVEKTTIGKATTTRAENSPPYGRFSEDPKDGKAPCNKNNKNKNKRFKTKSESVRLPHGRYKNVLLSEKELEMLRKEISHPERYIEQLSAYMRSRGYERKYKDHAATILRWAETDKEKETSKNTWKNKDYSYKEGESL